MRWIFQNFRYKLLALVGALLLWGVSHSESPTERSFDVPVVRKGVPANLVVTRASPDAVNVRIRGSRAAMRRLSAADLEFPTDLSGARPGKLTLEVPMEGLEDELDLPNGTKVVGRSPGVLEFRLERKGTRAVRVRADIEGQPAEGFKLGAVSVDPPRVRISGARSQIKGLREILTEPIDLAGANAPLVKAVHASLSRPNVWLEEKGEITVRVDILPETAAEKAKVDKAREAKTKAGKPG